MTSTALLLQRAARATEEAFELVETLDPLNEALQRAKNEPFRNDAYALPELVSAFAKVCYSQQRQIAELGEKVEALENPTAATEKG